MLVFHGSGGTGVSMERVTGFDDVADKLGFIVAYPNSVGPRWRLGPVGADNDMTFVAKLVRTLGSRYPVDLSRIYLSGYSQGAGLTQDVARFATDSYAGIADVAMNLNPYGVANCPSSGPIAFVLFHGTADPIGPYGGGPIGTTGADTYSAEETAAFWSRNNRCHGPPTVRVTSIPNERRTVARTERT